MKTVNKILKAIEPRILESWKNAEQGMSAIYPMTFWMGIKADIEEVIE